LTFDKNTFYISDLRFISVIVTVFFEYLFFKCQQTLEMQQTIIQNLASYQMPHIV